MERRVWVWIGLLWLMLTTQAQTNRTIKELQSQRSALQKEIAASEQLLLSAKKDVRSQLNDLNVLTGRIEQRAKLITAIERDVKTLDNDLASHKKQLATLQQQLAERKDKYAA